VAGEADDYAPLLTGFGFTGYRSWRGLEPARFNPLSKINLIVGQNNAGKSNVLRFLQRFITERFAQRQFLDIPQPDAGQMRVSIPVTRDRCEDRLRAFRQVADNEWRVPSENSTGPI